MRKPSRKMIILLILALLALTGLLFAGRDHPAIFAEIVNVTAHDADTIEVDGTRVPGGGGIWRYHIRADRWEKVPSTLVQFPPLGPGATLPPAQRVAVDRGSVTLCPGDYSMIGIRQYIGDMESEDDLETRRFVRVRLSDGQQTALGAIAHTPIGAGWGELPDGSGFWVREDRPTAHADWRQVLIHQYTYGTQQWKIAYRCPWYCRRLAIDSGGQKSILPSHGDWVLVSSAADYAVTSLKRPVHAELWVNLTTGAARLGEPAGSAFSPDGRYCLTERQIACAPQWPQGAGTVGHTYSLARPLFTVPAPTSSFSNDAPHWSPDSRYLAVDETAGPATRTLFDGLLAEIECHTSLRFTHAQPQDCFHLLDLTGKEIGIVSACGTPDFAGDQVLTAAIENKGDKMIDHYFLQSFTGKHKREIIRTLPFRRRLFFP